MALEVIAVGSDNIVRLDALTNASTGAYVNNATVSFNLNATIGGASVLSNVAMSYVAGSNGRYEGTIPAGTSLTPEALYTATITAAASGVTLLRKLSCVAKYRSNQ